MARGTIGISKGDAATDRMSKIIERSEREPREQRTPRKSKEQKDPFLEEYPSPRGKWFMLVEKELTRIRGPISHYWSRTTGDITWPWIDELWKAKTLPQDAARLIKERAGW
jgi:hypothetical protein